MGVNKSVKKGKKPHKNKATSKKYTKYKIEGDKIVRERSCPRCGPGIFLMQSQGRVYSEFGSKANEEEKKEN